MPLVLNHNDLYGGNILWATHTPEIILIDFEFSGPNLLGMDLINFINELMSDYHHPHAPFFKIRTSLFPKLQDLREMVHFFLFMHFNPELVKDIPNDHNFCQTVRIIPEFVAFDQDLVEKWVKLVPLFGQIVNAFWFWWSLYCFIPREISFDFGEFAKAKYEVFQFYKNLDMDSY